MPSRSPRPCEGDSSAIIAGPIAYSAPIATPSSSRTTSSCQPAWTNSCSRPKITKEMMSMVNRVRRPNRSVSQPTTGLPTKIPISVDAPISPSITTPRSSSCAMAGRTTLMMPRSYPSSPSPSAVAAVSRSRKPFLALTSSGTWTIAPSSLMLVVLLPPPWPAGSCSSARTSSRRPSSGHLRGQELPRGGRRALVAEHHLGVQLPDRRVAQPAADRVQGLRERRALGLQHPLIDHRRDVLVAEDVLRVTQDHVLPAAQLRVGRGGTPHLDLPAVQRRVDRGAQPVRHEVQVAQAVGLLQAHVPLIPGLLGG